MTHFFFFISLTRIAESPNILIDDFAVAYENIGIMEDSQEELLVDFGSSAIRLVAYWDRIS